MRGIFIFKDSLRDDVVRNLEDRIYKVKSEFENINKKLNSLSTESVIVTSLRQFDLGESLESGSLVFNRTVNGLKFAEGMRLISLNNKIVIDTKNPAFKGKPLLVKEIAVLNNLKSNKTGLKIFTDGSAIKYVKCNSEAGFQIGSILVYIKKNIFLADYKSMGEKELNFSLRFINDVIFYNYPRRVWDEDKVKKIALHFYKTLDTYYEDNNSIVIVPAKIKDIPFVLAYCADRNQIGLPNVARIILLLNLAILTAFIILFLIQLKTDKNTLLLQDFRNKIDNIALSINENTASAEKIIKETEAIYKEHDATDRTINQISEQKNTKNNEIIAPDEFAEESSDENTKGDYKVKDKDQELQTLIKNVSEFDKDKIDSELYDQMGIFGAINIDQYWKKMKPLLENSLKIRMYILLSKDQDNIYKIKESSGFESFSIDDFNISETENIFKLVLSKKKVLFIKDNALKNKTIHNKLHDIPEAIIHQMVFVPVINKNEICGILVLCKPEGEESWDSYSLHEIMYLSDL